MAIAAELESISSQAGEGSIAKGIHREIVTFSATGTRAGQGIGVVTYQLSVAQSGALVIFADITGGIVILPTPVKGCWFEFMVELARTSNATTIRTKDAAAESLLGSVISGSETVGEANDVFTANGSTHDKISMNGTTTGGEVGSRFVLTALSTTQWLIKGVNQGSGGAVVDPFAST